MMIQVQGRYAWVQQQGQYRLLHVEGDEPADIRTIADGGWVAFAQANRSEAQIAYEGVRYPPDGIISELQSRGIPYRMDEEQARVRVSVNRFQEFMRPLVLDRESITEAVRSQLLSDRAELRNPTKLEPKITKVKKHPDRVENPGPTLAEKPLAPPLFSVHPGASLEAWGPMMQTGMISEAFRALTFYAHDCNLEDSLKDDYPILSVLQQDKPFYVTKPLGWPSTNCRFLIASNPLPTRQGVVIERLQITAPSHFLIVDNYQYRDVRQITLLVLSETQVPFFRSGMAPQTIKLAKRARSDFHQKGVKPDSNGPQVAAVPSTAFSAKPRVLTPHGDWLNNPAVIAWLNENK